MKKPRPLGGRGLELVTKSPGSDSFKPSRRPRQTLSDVAPNWRSVGPIVAEIVGKLHYGRRRGVVASSP